jgi:glycosyltransferase involved in cell wall biosynthesis
MKNRPQISVVLGSLNRKPFLKKTIESVRKELEPYSHEIFVVDGGSTDGSLKWLTKQKDIITIAQHNRGTWRGKPIQKKSWGYFMNLAFKACQGKYTFMLSDDCLIIPGSVKNAFEFCGQKEKEGVKLGALAFNWRHWPEQEDYGVHVFYGIINMNHGFYSTEAMQAVNFLDETSYNFYSGDVDIIYAMKYNGYEIFQAPSSFIEHYSHANLAQKYTNWETHKQDNRAMVEKWREKFPDVDFSDENRWRRETINFVDSTETWREFSRLHTFNIQLLYRRLFNKHIQKH